MSFEADEWNVSKTVLKNLKSYPVTVLLVDDQPVIAEAVKYMLQDQENIVFHYCSEPENAIRMAREVKPTIILQDLVRPGVDGLTLLRYYKADPATLHVPVIILSTKEEPLIKADAFALGAADYIVKLPDKIEFLARIRHHSESFIHLLERNDAYEKLVESQELLNTDLRNAADYVTSLLPLRLQGDVEATWRFIPSAQLGGDAFGYYWLDADHFVIYLLDVCGHGVGAALLSITVANVILSRSHIDMDFKNPAHVLANLNEMFPMEKHNNMFFTIWYGIYNRKSGILKYSSGGHPPALLYDLDSKNQITPYYLRTEGFVIGAMSNASYMNNEIQVPFNNRLFLYSDGVYELKNTQNNQFISLDQFVKVVDEYVTESHHELDKIVAAARQLQNGKIAFIDDFSIVELTFHTKP